MQAYVTHATAIALQKAGFPRPAQPKFGDMFYMGTMPVMYQQSKGIPDGDGGEVFVSIEFLKCVKNHSGEYILFEAWEQDAVKWPYAPIATDITDHLDGALMKYDGRWVFMVHLGCWEFEIISEDERAVEAAAQAWLKENPPKPYIDVPAGSPWPPL